MVEPSKVRFWVWEASALYLGPGLAATRHAHHAIQVCIPLSGAVRLRSGPSDRWHAYEAAIIPANQPHESDEAVAAIASLWIEPNSRHGWRLASCDSDPPIVRVSLSRVAAVLNALRACWRSGVPPPATVVDVIVDAVATRSQIQATESARVTRALEILATAPERKIRLAELAAGVSLSPSRIAHLLRAEIGMPARRYLLWLRLRDAVQALAQGASITDAAQAAGFADAPHLNRTFRRMLGFTPSAALRVSKFVQDASASTA